MSDAKWLRKSRVSETPDEDPRKSQGRGQRLLTLSRELVPDLLKDRPAQETTLPEDAELEELWHHKDGYGYVLRLSSTEWEVLDEGEPIPEVTVEVTEEWTDE